MGNGPTERTPEEGRLWPLLFMVAALPVSFTISIFFTDGLDTPKNHVFSMFLDVFYVGCVIRVVIAGVMRERNYKFALYGAVVLIAPFYCQWVCRPLNTGEMVWTFLEHKKFDYEYQEASKVRPTVALHQASASNRLGAAWIWGTTNTVPTSPTAALPSPESPLPPPPAP